MLGKSKEGKLNRKVTFHLDLSINRMTELLTLLHYQPLDEGKLSGLDTLGIADSFDKIGKKQRVKQK